MYIEYSAVQCSFASYMYGISTVTFFTIGWEAILSFVEMLK